MPSDHTSFDSASNWYEICVASAYSTGLSVDVLGFGGGATGNHANLMIRNMALQKIERYRLLWDTFSWGWSASIPLPGKVSLITWGSMYDWRGFHWKPSPVHRHYSYPFEGRVQGELTMFPQLPYVSAVPGWIRGLLQIRWISGDARGLKVSLRVGVQGPPSISFGKSVDVFASIAHVLKF